MISFDCANTLLWTDWKPHTFAVRCAEKAGIELPSNAAEVYLQLFVPKLPEFWKVNQQRSFPLWTAFWIKQVQDWFVALGMDPAPAEKLHLDAENEMFAGESDSFRRFPETVFALSQLRAWADENQAKLVVLSNWDHSLDGILKACGIDHFFDTTFASLHYGVEKPDTGFFRIMFDRLGARPDECFHIGDDPVDDVDGAKGVGMPVVLIDRNQPQSRDERRIQNLNQVLEAMTWFD